MSISLLRRSLLYFFSAFFLVFGLVGLFMPAMLILEVHLRPITLAGLGEMRALYGGGFFAFGLVMLLGLHRKNPGLLLSMAIILCCIAVGRLFSIIFDQDFSFALSNAILEFVVAALCYYESRANA